MDSYEVDPMIAAGVVLDYFINHKKPFSDLDWKEPGTQVPSAHLDLIRISVVGYQLFTYLKLIEQKFGLEIARIIREYLIIALNRLPEKMGDQLSQLLQMIQHAHEAAIKNPMKIPNDPHTEVPIEWLMALHLLCFGLRESPHYIPHDQRRTDTTLKILTTV